MNDIKYKRLFFSVISITIVILLLAGLSVTSVYRPASPFEKSRPVPIYPGRRFWKTLDRDQRPDESNENVQCIQRPHLMLFGKLYWLSGDADGPVPTQELVYIGEVAEEVDETPVHDFQGYFIDEGTKIYYDKRFPQIVYLDSPSYMIRCATEEASKDYLYYNGTVYVSMTSVCSWDYESYQHDYVPLYGDSTYATQEIPEGAVCPEGAVYLGDTKFIGYNKFVHDEFECNQYDLKPSPIYQDRDDPRILYLTDYSLSGICGMIYVPILGTPPS